MNIRPHTHVPHFVPAKRHNVEFWQQSHNQRAYFDWLAPKVGVKTLNDWYDVLTTKLVQSNAGWGLFQFKTPLVQTLMNAYPEHNWVPWKFRSIPLGYWKDMNHQRNFFEWLGKDLGVEKLDDWYEHLSIKLLQSNGGGAILDIHGSPLSAITAVYPQHNWIPWKFNCVANGFWLDKTNHTKYFEWLGQQLGVKELDDWYEHLSQKTIHDNGGIGLLACYNNSPIAALASVYPQHDWKPWRFQTVPRDFWTDPEHQRQFFDWVGQQIGIKQWEDWYDKLSQNALVQHGGRALLLRYGSSPAVALLAVYPEHPWQIWRFKTVPSMFWSSRANQKQFMEWLAAKLGVTQLDDWYKVASHKVINDAGGGSLLEIYQSPYLILKSLYPEKRWIPWKFQSFTPRYFYKDKALVREWLEEVAQNLHVQQLDDWYRISHKQLVEISALHIIKRYGGLYRMVSEFFPEHRWERQKFADRGKKSSQRWLFNQVKTLFPNQEVLESYHHREMIFKVSGRQAELDIYVPSKSLAFEYQGEQHYRDIGFFAPQQRYNNRDEEKKKHCQDHDITLIEIPYWWDKKIDSLVATIHQARPDIQFPIGISFENATPIPTTPPALRSQAVL